jgi:hypothetical protein
MAPLQPGATRVIAVDR